MRISSKSSKPIVATVVALQIIFIGVFAYTFAVEARSLWPRHSTASHEDAHSYVQKAVDSLERRYESLMAADVFWSEWDAAIMHERHVKNGLAFLVKTEILDTSNLESALDGIFTATSRFKALKHVLGVYALHGLSPSNVKKYFEDEEDWLDLYKDVLRVAQKRRVELHTAFVHEAVQITLYVASICS